MTEQRFYIVYDGPALVNNEMDVRHLAPALHSLGDLFEASNRVVNGGAFKTQIKVKGSFKTGCFGVDLVFAQNVLESFVGLFSNQYIDAAINLLTVIGFASVGAQKSRTCLLNLLIWLKGRQIDRVIETEDDKVKVIVENDHIEIEKVVLKLFQDYEVRKALDNVIHEPLKTDGIDFFGVGSDSENIFKITKNDAPCFAAPEVAEELLNESTYETIVKVVNVAFQEDNMWRLSEGGNTFYAKIEDDEFTKDVQLNKRFFAKDDLFRVRLRQKQYLGEKGNVKMEYAVEEVLEHRSAARQLKLPYEK